MFRIALSPTFWARVSMEFTGEDGRKVAGAFRAKFKRHDQEHIEGVKQRMKDVEDVDAFIADWMRENIVEFADVEVTDDATGKTIGADDTQGLLDFFIRAKATQPFLQAYGDNAPKARAKN